MSAADHPAGKSLVCRLCAEPPNPVVRLKLPVGGLWACPHCDPNVFIPRSKETRP